MTLSVLPHKMAGDGTGTLRKTFTGSSTNRINITLQSLEFNMPKYHYKQFFAALISLYIFPEVNANQNEEARMIEEVVVVARKRQEPLSSTPVAITAITETTIKDLNTSNIEDIGWLAPNLTVSPSVGGSSSSVTCMRGMCRVNPLISEDPMVGTYLDGIYLGKAVGSTYDAIALSQVEVLRGPQGTLYGKRVLPPNNV